MKIKIITLLLLMPILACAQISTISENQKQQALKSASEFCSLLSQWSNGNRTLDSKIYSLCSGSDCSAYDDITTKKETTLRNYLMGIQKKFPKKIDIQISQPSLSNATICLEPEVSLSNRIGSADGNYNPFATTNLMDLNTNFFKNAYIIFRVEQTISSLSSKTTRMLIYNFNTNKISAYVIGQGTYISYLEGLNLLSDKNYKLALQKFHNAMNNSRSSLKYSSSLFALMCSIYIGDYSNISLYAKNLDAPIIEKYFHAATLLQNEKFNEVMPLITECEKSALETTKYNGFLGSIYAIKGILYSLPANVCQYRDLKKATEYFKKAINEGFVLAAYYLFLEHMRNDEYDNYISFEEVLSHLEWAANSGHTGAILLLGMFSEVEEDNDSAISWFEKGANLGDHVCMARLGKALLTKGGNNIIIGRKWLEKSLEGNIIDSQLENYSNIVTENFWPRSRTDIQNLLSSNIQQNTNSTSTTNSTLSNTTNTNQNHSNINSVSTHNQTNTQSTTSTVYNNTTTSYTPSYNSTSYKKYRSRKFNTPDWSKRTVGLSVGYVQKQWVYKPRKEYISEFGDVTEKYGFFSDEGEAQKANGIQTGLRIEPQFGCGFGLNTGIFYEYYWDKSNDYYDDYGYKFYMQWQEHSLNVPLHVEFRANFSEYFQIFFYGGASIDYGLSSKYKGHFYDDDYITDALDAYGDEMNRFNASWECGAGIRIKGIQIQWQMSKGLLNMADKDAQYTVKQDKPMMISLSWMF